MLLCIMASSSRIYRSELLLSGSAIRYAAILNYVRQMDAHARSLSWDIMGELLLTVYSCCIRTPTLPFLPTAYSVHPGAHSSSEAESDATVLSQHVPSVGE